MEKKTKKTFLQWLGETACKAGFHDWDYAHRGLYKNRYWFICKRCQTKVPVDATYKKP